MSAAKPIRTDPPHRPRTTESEVAELRTELATIREDNRRKAQQIAGLEKRLTQIESVLGARPREAPEPQGWQAAPGRTIYDDKDPFGEPRDGR